MNKRKLRSAISKLLIDNNLPTRQRFISQVVNVILEEKQATAEECWRLMNNLEVEQPKNLETDNWRNWKYIRNAIVDHFKLPSHKNKGVFLENYEEKTV